MLARYLAAFFVFSFVTLNSFASVYYCPGEPDYFTDEISRDQSWRLECRLVDGSPLEAESDPLTGEAIAPRRAAISLETRMAVVESKPPAKLRAFYRIAERVARVQQLAWTAGACHIRSLGWNLQVLQLYAMSYNDELAKQKFSVEELAIIYKHFLVATKRAMSD